MVTANTATYKGYSVGWFYDHLFFRIFEIICFCFVVAIFDLVHDVETIFHLPNS